MKKRFVILLGATTKEQDEAVRLHFAADETGWWHWLPGSWLVVDTTGLLTANNIRNDLGKILPGVHKVVLEFNATGDTWAGFGPTTEKKDMFAWFRRNWDTDQEE